MCASFGLQLDQDNSSPDAGFSARKAPENVWRPGSARTRWGSFSAPPDPLAAKGGLLLRGGGGKGVGGEGKGKGREGKGRGKGREGTPKGWLTPPMFQILKKKHCPRLILYPLPRCWCRIADTIGPTHPPNYRGILDFFHSHYRGTVPITAPAQNSSLQTGPEEETEAVASTRL